MKLRTKIRGFADGTHYAAVKAGDNADAINYDAACAHALMLAIHNRIDRARDAGEFNAARRLYCIIQYADEIMREWGFDSGEDAS